jgi:DNA-binding GntR family transcriptional regulator
MSSMPATAAGGRIAGRRAAPKTTPGEQLPPYRVLADLYNVSFSTMARVMTLLRERTVVVGIPGRGVFVPE